MAGFALHGCVLSLARSDPSTSLSTTSTLRLMNDGLRLGPLDVRRVSGRIVIVPNTLYVNGFAPRALLEFARDSEGRTYIGLHGTWRVYNYTIQPYVSYAGSASTRLASAMPGLSFLDGPRGYFAFKNAALSVNGWLSVTGTVYTSAIQLGNWTIQPSGNSSTSAIQFYDNGILQVWHDLLGTEYSLQSRTCSNATNPALQVLYGCLAETTNARRRLQGLPASEKSGQGSEVLPWLHDVVVSTEACYDADIVDNIDEEINELRQRLANYDEQVPAIEAEVASLCE